MRFSPGKENSKLAKLEKATGKKVYSFSLLSGYTCPFAKDCKSMAVPGQGIIDAPTTLYRCFSASQEHQYRTMFDQREHNTNEVKRLLRSPEKLADALSAALPACDIIRVHVGGDFFHKKYLQAWCIVAKNNNQMRFYAYTKALPLLTEVNPPDNFAFTMSRGGTHDHLIEKLKPRFCEARVVYYDDGTIEIDHDDTHACYPRGDFGLLIHGTQPKGSELGKLVYRYKRGNSVLVQ